jgi:hypothetical protein
LQGLLEALGEKGALVQEEKEAETPILLFELKKESRETPILLFQLDLIEEGAVWARLWTYGS